MSLTSRHWTLARRPQASLCLGDLERIERPVPEPADGEVLIRVLYLAMDPAVRGFMNASGNYAAPIPLGAPVRGVILGEVIRSRSAALAEGRIVWGFGSWSDYVVGPAAQYFPAAPAGFPLPAYIHALGAIGLTAHYGLLDIGALRAGDTLLVSAAAGATGSLVGQMAKINGASRIVGIAGGPAKCRLAVERYGYDECIDYKAVTNLGQAIGAALPKGVDVVFDGVGGAVLEAAIDHLAKNARIALCGMIAGYNASARTAGPANLWNLVVKTARMHGFLVSDIFTQPARVASTLAAIADWVRQGRLVYDLDIRDGFDRIPEIYNALFTGATTGRLVVRLADSPSAAALP